MRYARLRHIFILAAAFLAPVAWLLFAPPVAAEQAAPVKVTIRITDSGFDPKSVDVPMGAQVELTFVWDQPAHPDETHVITVPGYKLESEQVDRTNKQTVLAFVATKTGSFNFKCDTECDTHDYLQAGTINVVAGGAPSAGGTGGGGTAASLQASKLLVDPVTGVMVRGNSVSIAASLKSTDGKPISKAEVAFFAKRSFLGREAEVPIGTGKTDAAGNVYTIYHPTNADGGSIIARFEGGGLYDKTEVSFSLAPSTQFQPVPLGATDDDLHGIKRIAPFALIGLVGGVWLSFAFMLFQAWGISRVRPEGGPSR